MTDALTDAQVAAIRERAESEDIPALQHMGDDLQTAWAKLAIGRKKVPQ